MQTEEIQTFEGEFPEITTRNYDGFIVDVIPVVDYENFIAIVKYVRNSYNIIWNLNYEEAENIPEDKIYGAEITIPTDSSREGYVFDGWYKDVALTESVEEGETMPLNDLILYAKWTVEEGITE